MGLKNSILEEAVRSMKYPHLNSRTTDREGIRGLEKKIIIIVMIFRASKKKFPVVNFLFQKGKSMFTVPEDLGNLKDVGVWVLLGNIQYVCEF